MRAVTIKFTVLASCGMLPSAVSMCWQPAHIGLFVNKFDRSFSVRIYNAVFRGDVP